MACPVLLKYRGLCLLCLLSYSSPDPRTKTYHPFVALDRKWMPEHKPLDHSPTMEVLVLERWCFMIYPYPVICYNIVSISASIVTFSVRSVGSSMDLA